MYEETRKEAQRKKTPKADTFEFRMSMKTFLSKRLCNKKICSDSCDSKFK